MGEKRILDTNYVYIELEDGIMRGYYKPNVSIDLHAAKEIVDSRNAFFENRAYPAIIFDKGVKGIDKQARDYFSTIEGSKGIKAAALVLDSTFSMMLGNFILKISRPVIPAKIFTKPEKALKWLNNYKA